MRTRTLLLLTTAVAACRDAQGPYTIDVERGDTTAAVSLTASPGADHQPVWARSGDSVYYVGETFPGLPPGRGLLLGVPRHGGQARLLLPEIQGAGVGGPRWLASPALSPDGSRVAFLEMAGVAEAARIVSEEPCTHFEPLLDSLVLRVRGTAESGPISGDPFVPVPLQGRDPGQRTGGAGPFTMRVFPFQRAFADGQLMLVRPSWASDGNRIVFTDGLRLLIWAVGGSAPAVVPETEDGLSPAWSPDGQWIAFTRVARADSSTSSCDVAIRNTTVRHDRIGYTESPPVVVLVRPDGSGARELTAGEEPAWSPDSQSIYFVRDGRIWSIPITGGAPVAIDETEFGRSPAISPDGARIAFARLRPNPVQLDLWSVPLSR
jgi:Tol biopolymer transport system component